MNVHIRVVGANARGRLDSKIVRPITSEVWFSFNDGHQHLLVLDRRSATKECVGLSLLLEMFERDASVTSNQDDAGRTMFILTEPVPGTESIPHLDTNFTHIDLGRPILTFDF